MTLLQEKCGIVGIFAPGYRKQLQTALAMASGVQHRGQQGAGIVMKTTSGFKKHVGDGILKIVFTPQRIKAFDFPSLWTLVHCRYGTYGGYLSRNLQPCIIKTKSKEMLAVVHNGEFAAIPKIRMKIRGEIPEDASDTYLFTQMLAQFPGTDWDRKIMSAVSEVSGAFSMMIGIGDVLYIIRDSHGIRPLFIGKLKNQGYLIASETHAFEKVHAQVLREVNKGEIIKIDKKRITRIRKGTPGLGNFCDFEWAYFSRPDSLFPVNIDKNKAADSVEWLSTAVFRERCGEILAQEAPLPKANFIVGVPDSGVNVAIGYAKALKLPYRQVLLRDHFDINGDQRLFMRDDDMSHIKTKVLGKISFVPDKSIWKDAVVVLGDDSIVRGNVSEKITGAVFALGAREVHWIVGFPPVTYPCHLGVSMRTGKELIARENNSDPIKIAKAIGATSVNYISPKGFIQAKFGSNKIIYPKDELDIFLVNGGCGGCLTGRFPVAKDGTAYESNL